MTHGVSSTIVRKLAPDFDELLFLTHITTDPISKINRKDAAKLTNRTVPIPGDPDHYAVSIDIFHQLHCLVFHPDPLSCINILTLIDNCL